MGTNRRTVAARSLRQEPSSSTYETTSSRYPFVRDQESGDDACGRQRPRRVSARTPRSCVLRRGIRCLQIPGRDVPTLRPLEAVSGLCPPAWTRPRGPVGRAASGIVAIGPRGEHARSIGSAHVMGVGKSSSTRMSQQPSSSSRMLLELRHNALTDRSVDELVRVSFAASCPSLRRLRLEDHPLSVAGTERVRAWAARARDWTAASRPRAAAVGRDTMRSLTTAGAAPEWQWTDHAFVNNRVRRGRQYSSERDRRRDASTIDRWMSASVHHSRRHSRRFAGCASRTTG